MFKFVFIFLAACALLVSSPSFAKGLHGEDDNVVLIFHRDTCPHCVAALKFFKTIEKEYPTAKIKYYEVSTDKTNIDLFISTAIKYKATPSGVPFMFFCKQYLYGFAPGEYESKIRDALNECITKKPEASKASK
jgi:glutaredoxin